MNIGLYNYHETLDHFNLSVLELYVYYSHAWRYKGMGRRAYELRGHRNEFSGSEYYWKSSVKGRREIFDQYISII